MIYALLFGLQFLALSLTKNNNGISSAPAAAYRNFVPYEMLLLQFLEQGISPQAKVNSTHSLDVKIVHHFGVLFAHEVHDFRPQRLCLFGSHSIAAL